VNGPSSNMRDRWPAIVVYLGWCVLLAVGLSLPYGRAWGINLLAFASPTVRVGFGVVATLGLLFIALPVSIRKHGSRDFAWPGWAMVAALVVGAIASLLHSREAYLGDGTMRAMDTARGIGIIPSELLPSIGGTLLAYVLPVDASIKGYLALRILSIVFAMIPVYMLWVLLPRVTGSSSRSLIFWILSMGSVRLLAGYIETYTPAFAFFTLWAVAAWGYHKRTLSAWWLIAFWIGALLSHVTAVFLLPAMLWLLAQEPDGRLNLKRPPLLRFAALGGLLTAGVLIAFYLQQVNLPGVATGHFFVTLESEAPHYYGLLSTAHLLDLVNHWLLIAPAAIATAVALLLTPKAIFGDSTNSRPTRLFQNPTLVLWTLVGAVPFLAGFAVDPKLGWPRDWDLYALLSAPACVGLAIWLDRQSSAIRRAAMAIAATSAALWLTFSVDGRAEQRRFEALLDLDVSRSDYGHEIMAQQYRREGDHEGMLRHYRAALAISENHRYRMNIAASYFYLNKFDEAERWYRGVIARDSNNADAYHGLSLALSELRRPDEALSSALNAVTLNQSNPEFVYRVGNAYLEMQRFHEALPYLMTSYRNRPSDAPTINALAVCYLGLGRLEEAHAMIEKALELRPEPSIVWLNAARISLRRGDFALTAKTLGEYDRRVPGPQRHTETRMIRDSLTRMGLTP